MIVLLETAAYPRPSMRTTTGAGESFHGKREKIYLTYSAQEGEARAMDAMLRFSGAGKRDPVIEEWLNKTDALTAIARTWFKRMRACGDDVLELMHDGHPVACVEDAPFA